jgi:hypothetical protein
MTTPQSAAEWLTVAACLALAGVVGAYVQALMDRRQHRAITAHHLTRMSRLETAVRQLTAVVQPIEPPAGHGYPPPLNRAERAALAAVVQLRPVPTPLRHRIEAGDPALTAGPILFAHS